MNNENKEELHEGGAMEEEAAQGGADGQADEASLSKVQKTAFYDKDSLRSDYLAQDIIFARLDVMEQQVQEPMDKWQLKVEERALYKHREVQENIMSREYRYKCMENYAVVDQGDEDGRLGHPNGGQHGGAHSAEEGVVGGQHGEQHAQRVAEAGEASHNVDGGPGVLSEEGAGDGGDDREHGHALRRGGVRWEGQQGEEGGGQQEGDSLGKRRKRRAKKQLLGVEPGLVQLKISQFVQQFPNLKKGGPMMRQHFCGESASIGMKRGLQPKRKSNQVEGPAMQYTKRIRCQSTGTP